jgi:hypothetical protein
LRSRSPVGVVQLWIVRPLNPRSNLKTEKPFQKSFYSAGIVFAMMVCLLHRGILFHLFIGLCAALAAGTCGYFSRVPWKWSRYLATVFIFYFAFLLLLGFVLVKFFIVTNWRD